MKSDMQLMQIMVLCAQVRPSIVLLERYYIVLSLALYVQMCKEQKLKRLLIDVIKREV